MFKESYNKYKYQWNTFLIIGVILIFAYRNSLLELARLILQWTFISLGADLFFFKKMMEG